MHEVHEVYVAMIDMKQSIYELNLYYKLLHTHSCELWYSP